MFIKNYVKPWRDARRVGDEREPKENDFDQHVAFQVGNNRFIKRFLLQNTNLSVLDAITVSRQSKDRRLEPETGNENKVLLHLIVKNSSDHLRVGTLQGDYSFRRSTAAKLCNQA